MYAEASTNGISLVTESKGKGVKRGLLSFVHNALFLIHRKVKETCERIHTDESVDTYGYHMSMDTYILYIQRAASCFDKRRMAQTPQSGADSFSKISSQQYLKIRTTAVQQHLFILTQLVVRRVLYIVRLMRERSRCVVYRWIALILPVADRASSY